MVDVIGSKISKKIPIFIAEALMETVRMYTSFSAQEAKEKLKAHIWNRDIDVK